MAAAQSPARVLDLGHPLSAQSPSWSGKPVFERTGSPAMGRIATDKHFGTHLDAPIHFGGTWSVEQIPVDRLVHPGVCIAVTGKPEDYRITLAGVKAWEAQHGLVPEGAIVFFATGWDARWPDATALDARLRQSGRVRSAVTEGRVVPFTYASTFSGQVHNAQRTTHNA